MTGTTKQDTAIKKGLMLVSEIATDFQKATLKNNSLVIQRGLSGMYWHIVRGVYGVEVCWINSRTSEEEVIAEYLDTKNVAQLLDHFNNITHLCIYPRFNVNHYDHIYTICRLVQTKGGERYLLDIAGMSYMDGDDQEAAAVYSLITMLRAVHYQEVIIGAVPRYVWLPSLTGLSKLIQKNRVIALVNALVPHTTIWKDLHDTVSKLR